MEIDTTFLKPHPATVTWWSQRAVCRTCVHHDQRGVIASSGGSLGERCRAVRLADIVGVTPYEQHRGAYKPSPKGGGRGGTRKSDRAYCIDARLPGSPCGPEAKLYELAEETMQRTRSLLVTP